MDLRKLRSEVKRVRTVEGEAEAIAYLWTVLDGLESPDDRIDVMMELQAELIRGGRHAEYSELVRSAAMEAPDSASALIALAEHLLYNGSPREAFEVSEQALAVAKDKQQLVRHALMTKARIERRLGRYGDFELTLREILREQHPAITADKGYDESLVEGLPDGRVDEHIVGEFRLRARSRRGARGA